MFKVGIIGSENSHAGAFINIFKKNKKYSDIVVTHIGGMYDDSNKKLSVDHGLTISKTPSEMVGNIDAAMITTRDGKYHAEQAMVFLEAGIPVFIDKPFTIDYAEAKKVVEFAKSKQIAITGGSSLKSCYDILLLKNEADKDKKAIKGGFMVAPLSMHNEYSGFYFYASHLVEMCLKVFGYDPVAVTAKESNDNVTATVEYEDYLVSLLFANDGKAYFGQVVNKNGIYSRNIDISLAYTHECDEFAAMLRTGEMSYSYEQLIKPVSMLNAIWEAYTTQKKVYID